jgi:cellobiose phosphorylase
LYEKRRDEMKARVMEHGWEDGYLIYGYNDYDEKIGSKESDYGKIYLNPQAWAPLADLTDKQTMCNALDIAEERLGCDYGYVVCAPAYHKSNDRVGRCSYSCPGITENGSVYNHGVAFKIVGDCVLGRGDNAYNTFKMLCYDNPKNPNNGVEPYAFSNMYVGPENPFFKGFAPMSWVTGTAGWIYRALTEYICGIRPVKDGLLVSPCFPSHWDKASVVRLFRGGRYEINIIRSQENKTVFDGKVLSNNVLPIGKKGETHTVDVYFKA